MVDRMQNKSEINCQLKVLERRRTGIVFDTVPLVSWQQINVWQKAE